MPEREKESMILNIGTSLPREAEPPPPPKKEREGGEKKRVKNEESGVVISSLFKGNPSIPELGHLKVDKADMVKESLFTELTFSSPGLIHPYLVKNLESMGINRPTAVQSAAIPRILAGKDVLVKSQTGSGKTLCYALPLIHSLQALAPPIKRDSGVYALVILPTRELALQTYEWFSKLLRSFTRIVPGVLHGGEKRKSEKARLRKGVNILVSTPGRLLDHVRKTQILDLSKVAYLVFDEADRILDLGYERDVNDILSALNEKADENIKRQTILLSATLTKSIQQLSEVSLKHPDFVDVAAADGNQVTSISDSLKLETAVPEHLQQTFTVVPAKLRLVTLASFILWKCRRGKSSKKVLVFLATQDMVDYHMRLFEECLNSVDDNEKEIRFLKLHGNMTQAERTKVFNEFRENRDESDIYGRILLCTDVAARGLDLPKVDWIVQYNPPISTSDYVHRIGRTARIGSKGSSLLFVLPSEVGFLRELEGEKLASLVELTVDRILEKIFSGSGRQTLEESATKLQMNFENKVSEDKDLRECGSQAYVSLVRSYASYPKETRHIFCFKELHLGHIAKSFALRDAPTKITGLGKGGNWVDKQEKRRKNAEYKKEERVIKSQRKRINQRALIMSEFSSGLDEAPVKRKK